MADDAPPSAALARQLTTHFEAAQICESMGFRVREIPPDGNCLYRACAEICLGSQRHSAEVRQAAHEYIAGNRDRFEPFVDEKWEGYLGKLSTDGHWGSDLELQALAEIYQVSFTVHANMRASVNIAPQREDQRRRTTRAALWFAHGNHYNALYTMAEFERRGFHRSNRELEEYLEDRRANEEKSAQLTRELSEEPDEPPQQPLELSHSTLQDLRDAGIDEVELAQHISAATISAPTAAESARIQPRTLTDEQRRQPTVALLLAQGFTEAELAQNLNAAEHLREPRTAPGALSLPPELLRRQTVLGLLQAGVSEEEIRKQWFQPS